MNAVPDVQPQAAGVAPRSCRGFNHVVKSIALQQSCRGLHRQLQAAAPQARCIRKAAELAQRCYSRRQRICPCGRLASGRSVGWQLGAKKVEVEVQKLQPLRQRRVAAAGVISAGAGRVAAQNVDTCEISS